MQTETQERIPENIMGTLPIGRLLFKIAVPIMLSMLVQALYNVVDSIYVSRLGEDALNAVSLAFPLQNLMIGTGAGTAIGMNALLARSLGAKRQQDLEQGAGMGVLLIFFNAILFAVIGFFLSRPFYLIQTTDAEIIAYGTDYCRICLMCSVGLFGQFCFERMLQATGKTVLSMITQLIGAVINIILDPILIFGMFGMPAMGVSGAAVATVAGQIVAAIVALLINLKLNPEIPIRAREIRWNGRIAKEIYRVGSPTIVMQSTNSVMIFGMNLILISFTQTATAVFGAYFKLQSFVFMPTVGLNNGMVPILSYNYGARNPERVRKTVWLTIGVAIGIMTAGLIVFEAFPAGLLSFFDPSPEMLEIGVPALRHLALQFPLAGFCVICGSTCQSIGKPVHSLISSLCRQLVVLLPAAWLLAQTGHLELVWYSFPIAAFVCVIMNAFFVRHALRIANERMQRT